jgi:hypothetical protein
MIEWKYAAKVNSNDALVLSRHLNQAGGRENESIGQRSVDAKKSRLNSPFDFFYKVTLYIATQWKA